MKDYTKEEVDMTDIYRKSEDCVFPYHCLCEDCYSSGNWPPKMLAMAADNDIDILNYFLNKM